MNAKQKRIALRVLRKLLEREKTQAKVAKLLGYAQPYISLILNEKVNLTDKFNAALAKYAN